ncbi:TPA: YmfQ family protein [Serratia marcescens]
MAHSVTEWQDAIQQNMPRGRAWPRDETADLTALIRGVSHRLNRLEINADLLLAEMRPETTVQLLPEWENYLGLPECNIPNNDFLSRRAAVVEKYHRKGGLAPWQIENVAKALGYSVEVKQILPHHCLRNCMHPIYPKRYRFLLVVTVHDAGKRFTVLDEVLMPLIEYHTQMLECVLTKYRLAGFGYEYIFEVN